MPPCFTLTTGQSLAFAGVADRYQKNVRAITLLRELQAAGRAPDTLSDDERLTLAHYSAFGESALLRRAFGDDARGDLDDLVSASERNALKRASLNAFYTSQEVLDAKWAALAPLLAALPGTLTMLELEEADIFKTLFIGLGRESPQSSMARRFATFCLASA